MSNNPSEVDKLLAGLGALAEASAQFYTTLMKCGVTDPMAAAHITSSQMKTIQLIADQRSRDKKSRE
jgi:hypothetical protein